MAKQLFRHNRFYATVIIGMLTGIGLITINYSCNKGTAVADKNSQTAKTIEKPVNKAEIQATKGEFSQSQPITAILTVAAVRSTGSGATEVMFLENEEILNTSDATIIASLQSALQASTPVKVTFDPWQATISNVVAATSGEISSHNKAKIAAISTGVSLKLQGLTDDQIDHNPEISGINTTTGSLTGVIPDMATAQEMFNYISSQCCRLAGPYAIDYCITFQYCPDGCYARAHKMCWILNKKYNYATQKVFSFANAGSDELCVKAERWGGCCINWWYHVAPLVTINTDQGPKAYVFDPAMFLQPVLLSAWLHAQENPACVPSGDVPHVSMINVQPTSSYSPSSYSGYTFDTDPTFSQTDTTLVNYRNLVSCP